MSKFAIGAAELPGVYKIQEESSELGVVLAKIVTVNDGEYWDGRNLHQELIDEAGDLLAALNYFMIHNPDKKQHILNRCRAKLKLFEEWHENYPEC